MNCVCCGRPTRPGAGAAARCVRYYVVGATTRPVAPWEDPLQTLRWSNAGCIVAEILCWTCFAWSAAGSSVFGKLYATR